MLKEEFLKLTGLEDISDAEYRGIEQVYEELPDIDKKDFCTMYRNEDFHQLMRWCKQLVSVHNWTRREDTAKVR